MNRRKFLGAAGGFALTGAGASLMREPAQAATLTEDGLYREPWFIESFLELPDDLEAAHKAGKRFVVMWELRGCPYCKETHLVNFAQERISNYVRTHFDVLQLNIIGARKVKDFDGEELTEKAFAAKYGIRFTPTFQFFPETTAGLKDVPPTKREVARIPGYLRPDDFLSMFRYVQEQGYKTKSFYEFMKSSS